MKLCSFAITALMATAVATAANAQGSDEFGPYGYDD